VTSDANEPTTAATPEQETALVVEALQGLPNRAVYNAIVTWGKLMAASGFFKDAKSAAQAAVKILYGTEQGFSIGASMAGVHMIEGRPTLAAHLQAQKVKQSARYDYNVIKLEDDECTIEWLRRGDDGKLARFAETTFTIEHAQRAGLLGRTAQNWERYPRNMLFARALTNGIRFYCPDIFTAGPVYTPDELAPDLALTESGDLIEAVLVAPNTGVALEGEEAAPPARAPQARGAAPTETRRTAPARGQQQRAAGRGQPTRPEDIRDVGGLLWWARGFLADHDRANGTQDIFNLFGVGTAVELRERTNGDFQSAAAYVIAQVQGPPQPPTPSAANELTPEQRAIYDDVISAGSSHEDAMLLARDEGDDVSEEEQDADDDDPERTGGAAQSEPAAGESRAIETTVVEQPAASEGDAAPA
jgi:hypothetical protein